MKRTLRDGREVGGAITPFTRLGIIAGLTVSGQKCVSSFARVRTLVHCSRHSSDGRRTKCVKESMSCGSRSCVLRPRDSKRV